MNDAPNKDPAARAIVDDASTAPRRFARFTPQLPPPSGAWPLPPDGLCLSAFVLLSPGLDRRKVLLGKLDPLAPWERIGGLDRRRMELNSTGWMIPSCHLLYFESPKTAADRVLEEQLGLTPFHLEGPDVFSEVYRPARHPSLSQHWDLGFVFRGKVDVPSFSHPAWRELRCLDPATTPRAAFTRSHDEVLEFAGYRIG